LASTDNHTHDLVIRKQYKKLRLAEKLYASYASIHFYLYTYKYRIRRLMH